MEGIVQKIFEYAGGVLLMGALFWLGSVITKPQDGAYEKILATNPEYQDPNRYFQILVEDFHSGNSENKKYYDLCDQYGYDWKLMGACVGAYSYCLGTPPDNQTFMCLEERVPYNWRMGLHGRKKYTSHIGAALQN